MSRAERITIIIAGAVIAWLGACLLPASGADVTVQWTYDYPPDVQATVTGFRVYGGWTASRDYSNVTHSVGGNAARSCKVLGLDPARTHYFAVTAYNASDNESDYSAELVWDKEPPVGLWSTNEVRIPFSPWRVKIPDCRAFVMATDDISSTDKITKTQTPLPGTTRTVNSGTVIPIVVTLKDEAGNTATMTMQARVEMALVARPTNLRGTP